MAGRGQPTKYRKEYNKQAYKLCLLGATDVEMADFFEVEEKTINNWKQKHPKFLQSLKEGKLQADAEVADKLFQRAKGYEHPEDKVFCNNGEITTYRVTKHYPPEVGAIALWLKNRRHIHWKDSRGNLNVSGDLIVNVQTAAKKKKGKWKVEDRIGSRN
jgi:hypothetical protein